eukprot:7513947-Pyramimonas_sp.AAC.1
MLVQVVYGFRLQISSQYKLSFDSPLVALSISALAAAPDLSGYFTRKGSTFNAPEFFWALRLTVYYLLASFACVKTTPASSPVSTIDRRLEIFSSSRIQSMSTHKLVSMLLDYFDTGTENCRGTTMRSAYATKILMTGI